MNSGGTRPISVEIIGVAGSGKSSLARALAGNSYTRPPFISASDPRHLAVILRVLPRLWPLLVQGVTRSPRMSWADFKLMAYITGWREYLTRLPEARESTLVFDQGPLYALGRLEAKGLGMASTPAYQRWWDEMLSLWAAEISMVVWLDATEEQLLDRINRRPQDHEIKGRPDDESSKFIGHYREVFRRLLARIEELGAAEVVSFDTTALDTDQLSELVQELVRNHSSQ
jgi:deoxyadenosine/deoxycytidine kinase